MYATTHVVMQTDKDSLVTSHPHTQERYDCDNILFPQVTKLIMVVELTEFEIPFTIKWKCTANSGEAHNKTQANS